MNGETSHKDSLYISIMVAVLGYNSLKISLFLVFMSLLERGKYIILHSKVFSRKINEMRKRELGGCMLIHFRIHWIRCEHFN